MKTNSAKNSKCLIQPSRHPHYLELVEHIAIFYRKIINFIYYVDKTFRGFNRTGPTCTVIFSLRQFRLTKWSSSIHSTTPYIHLMLDFRIGPYDTGHYRHASETPFQCGSRGGSGASLEPPPPRFKCPKEI